MTYRPTLRDRARRTWYLTRFAWSMQDYPQRGYRTVRRDLRREIDLAAQDVGMAQALGDLGHPRVLAEGYLAELGHRRPRWASGAVAATFAAAMVLYLGMAYSFGTLDTLDALGGGTVTRFPFGAETVFHVSDDALYVETRPSVAGAVFVAGLATVTFLLASRSWRALV